MFVQVGRCQSEPLSAGADNDVSIDLSRSKTAKKRSDYLNNLNIYLHVTKYRPMPLFLIRDVTLSFSSKITGNDL